MYPFERARVDDVLSRLARVAPDTPPQWGKMNTAQMLGHLRQVVRYTMGEGPDMPFKGNAFSRHVFRHLVLHRIVAVPKNIRLPRPAGMKEMPPPPEATVETLKETLDEYLDRLAAGNLPGRMHPFFGPLTASEWNKMHNVHFEHHLKQFGV